MTLERAIELLDSGTRMPSAPHTAAEMDAACQIACAVLRAQLASCSAAGKGTYRCYITVPGYEISCDRCLAFEIRMLNDMGIQTIGCCCGHGTEAGYIQVDPKCIDAMKRIGYVERKPDAFGNGRWCFEPKSVLLASCISKHIQRGCWTWFDIERGNPADGNDRDWGWKCSVCQEVLPDDYDDPEKLPKIRFCPYCGAKMDKEVGE